MNEELLVLLFKIVLELLLVGSFVVLVYIGKLIYKNEDLSNFHSDSRWLNPREYLPDEEVPVVKQVCYLVIIVLIVVDILYSILGWNVNMFYFSLFDIILSLHFAIHMDIKSWKSNIVLFGLIPFGSLGALFAGYYVIFDIIHLITLAYFIKVYYRKFVEYTETNSLGITIIFLFMIVFISFLITIVVEDKSPLDSIAMVSNAFTSNGYTVLGHTGLGKIDAIFLVWAGFALSCIGTATLSVSIVMNHINEKFDNLEELARKNRKK